jgi:RNA recognition motif-containing protein
MLSRDHQGNPPKLHVTNLSSSATLASLRELFRAAGDVVEVEFAAERVPGGRPSSAFVTMATASAAEEAVRRFHGRLFHDRSVMVVIAGEGDYEAARRANAKPKTAPSVAVQQQYRERNGMAYELDCTGLRLTVRFSYQDAGCKEHRVEVKATLRSDYVAEATAATRELALMAVAEVWGRPVDGPPAPTLDWPAITTALKSVRAV